MRMRDNTLLRRLRRDRGDADPLLTISAMAITLIISAAIVGSIVTLLTIGTKYTADQVTTTTLSDARSAFSADAQNASKVTAVLANTVTFYESASGSAINSDRGTNPGCRISQWSTTATAVTDKVWKVAAACPPTPPATGSTTLFNVTGFTAAPALTFQNAAGTVVTFDKNGLGGTPPYPKTGSYFTTGEFGSTIPKTITLGGTLKLQGAKSPAITFTGVTYLADDHDRTPSGVVETNPGVGVYDPAKPAIISVARSGSLGAVFGGAREGISIKWGAAYCGPYIVKYDVKWTPTTAGSSSQTYSVSGFLANYTKDFDKVPNGTIGTVSVTATCPSDVSKKPATTTAAYTQPLPAASLSAWGLTTTTHRLSWTTGLSSLPVQYLPKAKHSNQAAYGNAWNVTTSTFDWGWNPGATYGTSNYIVVASVAGGGTAPNSNVASVAIGWPAIAATGVWSYNDGHTAPRNNAIGWNSISCPAGTSVSYNPVVSGSGRGWRTSLSLSLSVSYSTSYSAYVQTRCQNVYGEYSGTTNSGTTYWTTQAAPPPVPSAPASCNPATFTADTSGKAIVTFVVNCSTSSYATSYTAYASVSWQGYGPMTGGTYSSSSPRIQILACSTQSGHGVVSVTAYEKSNGASGSSGYSSFTVGIGSAKRVGAGCS